MVLLQQEYLNFCLNNKRGSKNTSESLISKQLDCSPHGMLSQVQLAALQIQSHRRKMAGGANLCGKPESRLKRPRGPVGLGPLPQSSSFFEVIHVEEYAVH